MPCSYCVPPTCPGASCAKRPSQPSRPPAPLAVAAVAAAQRYLPERRLPDSAIDVMDEAAARARLRSAAAAAAAADWAQPAAGGTGSRAAAAGGGDPPLEAAGQSFEEAHRLMEWLSAQQAQQAQQQAKSGPAAVAAAQTSQSSGLSGAATHSLSCPHCGTPAAPVEGSGGCPFGLGEPWPRCLQSVLSVSVM